MTYTKPWEQGALKVTENGRYFSCGDTPFFWMGDTAWLLFHRLTEEETRNYLRNRKELGYNIILADFLHSPEQKNCAGEAALVNGDFNRINRDGGFWKHVDSVIRIAEELGLYIGILPVWGSSIVAGGSLNEENLDTYMDFILDRYHDAPNIVWIVGGDVRGDVNPGLFERMGQRMKQDNPGRLVGYHPFGRTSSSLWFHEAKWLDFNLFQSGHRRYDQTELGAWDDNAAAEGCFGEDCWRYVERDYGKKPAKPVLDGEPSYEWVVQGLHDKKQPYWKAADVRRYAYWNVFAGAAGHTYGHNSIMQFYDNLSEEGAFGARYLWSDAVHHPGGAQMIHLKRLMQSVDFTHGRPAEDYLLEEQGGEIRLYQRICRRGFSFCLYLYRQDNKPVPGTLPGEKAGCLLAGSRNRAADLYLRCDRKNADGIPAARERGRHGRRAGYQDIKREGQSAPPQFPNALLSS